MRPRDKADGEPGEDFGSTTAVIAYVRKRVTPTLLWSAIPALLTALGVSITWLVTTQADIHRHQESIAELQASREQNRQLLQQLVIGQTAMNGKIDALNGKVDAQALEMSRQRDWRDSIEREAEAPPHAARRHK